MSARKANKNNVASERIFLAYTVLYGEVHSGELTYFVTPSANCQF